MIRQPKKNMLQEEALQAIIDEAAADTDPKDPAPGSDDTAEKPDEAPADKSASAPSAPRRSGRKKRSIVNNRISLLMSAVFFAFMLILALLLAVLPRPATSSIERRSLATVPQFSVESYFSGEYTAGISLAYNDTVPGRDSLKNTSNNIKSGFGISTANTVEVIGAVSRVAGPVAAETVPAEDTPVQDTPVQDSSEQETTAAPQSEQTHSKNYHAEVVDVINEDGILVAYQDGHWRAMSLYQYFYDSLYNDVVNYVRQVVDEDVNIYFMPIPLAIQFYCPPEYMEYTTDLEEVFQEVSSHMISGIKCIDAIPALDAHNTEGIYLRTDHHWAPLGAYYTAKCFAENANVPFADLREYTEYVNEGYVGTMYAFTESANILNDPEDFVYYVPTNSYVADYYTPSFEYKWTAGLFIDTDVDNSYLTFLGGDDQIVKVTTDVKNGRRLLVIKDSYGNAMIPCLTSSFEEIYVIDQRYFDVNLTNFIAYNNITDVLFTNNYFCLAGPEAELLEYITYSNYDEVIYDEAPPAELPDRNKPASDTEKETDASEKDTDTAAEADASDEEGNVQEDQDAYYEEEYDAYYDDSYYDDSYYDDTYYDDTYNEDYYEPYDEYYETYDEQYM